MSLFAVRCETPQLAQPKLPGARLPSTTQAPSTRQPSIDVWQSVSQPSHSIGSVPSQSSPPPASTSPSPQRQTLKCSASRNQPSTTPVAEYSSTTLLMGVVEACANATRFWASGPRSKLPSEAPPDANSAMLSASVAVLSRSSTSKASSFTAG